ncbi:WXG100 family type VII secretion target [Paenibacillus shunpengii]|uniref:WXG100 family type VII secretion target n=1 Tax=Paenibacillus shunpengii TaxID=2054424 RepID=A0ABW5SIM4_9BACL
MTRIKVPIDVLLSVSDQFDNASNQLKMINENLLRQIFMLMSNWYGQRGTAFQTDFKTAYEQMNVTVERMHVISQELKGIAVRFMNADQLQEFMGEQRMELFAKLSTTSSSEPPRSFMDQVGDTAKDLAGGLKKGLGSVVESLKDTGTAIVKNPIGTLGDMAYNATVGTAEDVIGFAAWGKNMVMDEGEREAFLEGIQEEVNASGKANFVGEQAGVMLGSILVGKLGIKGGGPNRKPDTGGDGGSRKDSNEGTGDLHPNGTPNPTHNAKGERIDNVDIPKVKLTSIPEYMKQEDIANNKYASFRTMKNHISDIAKNTGWKEADIQQIKNHLFIEKHKFDNGQVKLFDPNYQQAMAWERMVQGNYNKNDILLLNHELFESNYMKKHGATYEKGHAEAQKYYNWSDSIYED